MAVEKGLLAGKLKAKFKALSLSKTFIDKIADKWAPKIETDEDIDAYINDREDVFTEASAEANRVRTEATAAATAKAAAAAAGKTTEEVEVDEEPEGSTPFEKMMLKQMKSFGAEIATMKSSQSQQTISERFTKDPDLKGIPAVMLKGRIPVKEEDYDAFKEELIADYGILQQQNPALPAIGADAPASTNVPPVPKAGEGKIAPELEAYFSAQDANAVKK